MALLPSNKRDQMMVLVILLAVGVVGAFWYFLYTPRQATLADMAAHADSLEAANTKAEREVKRGTAANLKGQAEGFQADLNVMRRLVPTATEVPALLEEVSTASRRVGLDISEVAPEGVIPGDRFDTYRYKIGVTGPYHEIGELLANVGSLERIVEPINLSLLPTMRGQPPRGRVDQREAKLDAKFEIRTYVVHSPDGVTQAGTPGSPTAGSTPTGAP